MVVRIQSGFGWQLQIRFNRVTEAPDWALTTGICCRFRSSSQLRRWFPVRWTVGVGTDPSSAHISPRDDLRASDPLHGSGRGDAGRSGSGQFVTR